MLSFIEFIKEIKTNKREKTNGRKYTRQGSGESGHVDNQRKADRGDQEIESEGIYVFTEPGK